jgi:nucleotide-binding universal stress UspA family protein
MYKKMLVLLDGSELAEVVFKYARVLSGRLGLDLELLHVASPNEVDQLPMRRGYIEHMAGVLCAEAEEIRIQSGAKSENECILARGMVRIGNPAEEILKHLDESDVDLVMMSTHGRSGLKGFDIGGVANKVIHASKVPVWLVPTELREEIVADQMPNRTTVIPLDGSKLPEAAIPHALSVAAQRGLAGDFLLLHVQEVPQATYNLSQVRAREENVKDMEVYLEGIAQRIRDAGHTAHTKVLVGDPVPTIINYIRDNPPLLLAMATRANTGISRMVFGNLTENVVRLIKKTPMLLVPAKE